MSSRTDSVENRLRLIETAEIIFADQGLDVPLEDIAKQTGVSRMTLYRHFKDRDTLCFAICERNVMKLETKAEELKNSSNAFLEILNMMQLRFAANQAMVEGLTKKPDHQDKMNTLMARVVAILTEPFQRAQQAGLIKNSLQTEDIVILIYMLGGAVGKGSIEARTERVKRALQILQIGVLVESQS